MFLIGDIVERHDLPDSRGRVTGFAPNGWVRIKLDRASSKIWHPSRLVLIETNEANRQWALHEQLKIDIAHFLDTHGEKHAKAFAKGIRAGYQELRNAFGPPPRISTR